MLLRIREETVMPKSKVKVKVKIPYKMVSHAKYPWDTWFSSKVPIVLTRGKEYTVRTRIFVLHARDMAKDRGLRITVNVLPDDKGVAFMVVRKGK
jgi:hypothetical protein